MSAETSQQFSQIIPAADLDRNRSDGSNNKFAAGTPGLRNNDRGLGGGYSNNHEQMISKSTLKVKQGQANRPKMTPLINAFAQLDSLLKHTGERLKDQNTSLFARLRPEDGLLV